MNRQTMFYLKKKTKGVGIYRSMTKTVSLCQTQTSHQYNSKPYEYNTCGTDNIKN